MKGPQFNPADELGNVAALVRRVTALEDRLTEVDNARRTYMQRGTVATFTGGSTTCTVTLPGGRTASVRFVLDYTPVPTHKVWVVFSPEGNVIVGRDSVP